MGIDSLNKSTIKKNGRFFQAIAKVCGDSDVKKAIEIGAGYGDGASDAIVSAFKRKNPLEIKYVAIELSTTNAAILQSNYAEYSWITIVNGNTGAEADMLTRADIKSRFWDYVTDFRKIRDLDDIYLLRQDEINYINKRGTRLTSNALAYAIGLTTTIDFILINGSDFLAEYEYLLAIAEAPLYIALQDSNSLKNYVNKQSIIALGEGVYRTYASGVENEKEWIIFEKV